MLNLLLCVMFIIGVSGQEDHNSLLELFPEFTQLNGEVRALKTELQDVTRVLRAEIRAEIERSKRRDIHVSFSARIGHNKKYRKMETLVFNNILNNDGNAYNARTGEFTAPVDGKYWFSASITVFHQAYAHVWIMKNNKELVEIAPDNRATSGGNWETSSVSTVMDLARGDTVRCRLHFGIPSSGSTVYGVHLNTFSGALLSQY